MYDSDPVVHDSETVLYLMMDLLEVRLYGVNASIELCGTSGLGVRGSVRWLTSDESMRAFVLAGGDTPVFGIA